ncbi:phage tail assembly protein [Caedibacter taeniospiralis]|uniref:phage tail assembly protein n=1 Tax=Caedibacter taeniospiralis TaxID=28907 RepID=UPI0037C0AF04
MKVTLRNQVKLTSGEHTNIIHFREPTRGDLKAVANIENDIAKEDMLISRLTGVSLASLDDVVMADSAKLQQALSEITDADYDPKSITN